MNPGVDITGMMQRQQANDLALQGGQLQDQAAAVQLQQQKLAEQHQQLMNQYRTQVATDPSPRNLTALMLLDPQSYQATKAAWDSKDEATQKAELTQLSAIRGNLAAGNPDAAGQLIQQRIDADQRAGIDTTADKQMLEAINANPDQARGLIDYKLAAVMGPQKWAEAFGQVQSNARENAAAPGKIALTAAQTAEAGAQANQANASAETTLHPLPKTATAGTDVNGNPIYYNPNGAPPAGSGATVSPDLQGFVGKLMADENSTGNPAAKNPNSTATGNGQFIAPTWLRLARQVRPDLASTPDGQVLAMRSDPGFSQQVTAAYALENAPVLQAHGFAVNGATLAMAHKLGVGGSGEPGALEVLNADPSTPMAKILSPRVMAANPQLKGLTAGQYANGLIQKFGTNALGVTPSDPTITGDAYLATLPPGRARQVQAIANGDLDPPSSRAAMTGPGQALMQQVLQYDPSASSINLPTRRATRKAFTTGTEGQALNSANTVIGHIVSLKLASDQLHNGGIPLLNGVANTVLPAVGNQDKQASLKRFNFFKTAVANELTKVFRGSNGAEADVHGWVKQLDPNSSPDQLNSTVQSMLEAMQSRLQSLGTQYSQGMGKSVDGIQLLSPHAQQQLRLLTNGGLSGQQRVAINPQTGQRIVYDPGSGQWKPG